MVDRLPKIQKQFQHAPRNLPRRRSTPRHRRRPKKSRLVLPRKSSHLDEPFLLHNVDVISNIDLNAMLQFHKEHHALATLAVQSRALHPPTPLQRPTPTVRPPYRRSGFHHRRETLSFRVAATTVISSEAKNLLLPREGTASAVPKSQNDAGALAPDVKFSQHLNALAFSGIHILSPRLLPQLTETAPLLHHRLLPPPSLPIPKNPSLPPRPLLLARPRQTRRPSPSRPRSQVTPHSISGTPQIYLIG